MIGRGADAVGCAHCTAMGGALECRICGRIVCKACADDWTTCDQPSGRILRLGLTARLRDVDPTGRLGLVGRITGRARLVDLRRLCWVEASGLPLLVSRAALLPRLTGDDRIIVPRFSAMASSTPIFVGFDIQSLRTGESVNHNARSPAHGAAVSARGARYYYTSDKETVEVLDLTALSQRPLFGGAYVATTSVSPLPGKVVQSAWVDDERDLLVTGTWGAVALHRLAGGGAVHAGSATTDGDVRWVAAAGDVVAAAVGTRSRLLVAWRVHPDLTIGPVVYQHEHALPVRAASISRDGRYLVIGLDDGGVVLHALASGTTTTFTEHSDTVSFVRFAGDDELLITADDDNRVVLRPRTPTGYAKVAISVELAAAVPLD